MKDSTRLWFEKLLICALREKQPDCLPDESEWKDLLEAFQLHKVLPLVYDLLCDREIPVWVAEPMEKAARSAAAQTYHLLFTTKYLVSRLEQAGVSVAVLKGCSTARYYPVPEMRKSGDVDLLLTDPAQLETARQVFSETGLTVENEQHGSHHEEWMTTEQIAVELHTRMIELVNQDEADRCILRQYQTIPSSLPREKILGVQLPVLPAAYDAYHLLLHMLQHFLGSGFGVRLLCDWVRFWNRPVDVTEIETFLRLVKECRLEGFLQMVTSVCVRFLGLTGCRDGIHLQENALIYDGGVFCELLSETSCNHFLTDVYSGGEFGYGEQGRMIVVQGRGFAAYVKEFHRQMKRNYSKASRYPILWPGLWIGTFVTFLCNNRKLNRGSVFSILRKTKARSSLLDDELHLFR